MTLRLTPPTLCLTSTLASPLESALTKNAPANPVESAVTKSLDLKSPEINTCRKRGGSPVLVRSSTARLFRVKNPAGSSLPQGFLAQQTASGFGMTSEAEHHCGCQRTGNPVCKRYRTAVISSPPERTRNLSEGFLARQTPSGLGMTSIAGTACCAPTSEPVDAGPKGRRYMCFSARSERTQHGCHTWPAAAGANILRGLCRRPLFRRSGDRGRRNMRLPESCRSSTTPDRSAGHSRLPSHYEP